SSHYQYLILSVTNNQQDLQQRHIAYGKNQIPRKPISYLPFTSEWKTEHEFHHPLLLGDLLLADGFGC
ncbi:unnamed protein product, partial [Adineta steineri]